MYIFRSNVYAKIIKKTYIPSCGIQIHWSSTDHEACHRPQRKQSTQHGTTFLNEESTMS